MKISDLDRIHQASLISDEQRAAIIAHFKLDQESNKILVILSILGGILVSAGLILLIAANWENIPRLIKLTAGLTLMLGAHVAGWRLRLSGKGPLAGEALHLIGSGLFLANIALVGQIYNLSSRTPNAFLLWLAGIAPLPWLLRSKTQHVLTLCALALWLGLELNQSDSPLYFDGGARQFIFYAILGITFAGLGMQLGQTSFADFGPATEKFGLLAVHIASYPLTLGFFYQSQNISPGAWAVAGIATALAATMTLVSTRNEALLPDRQWRWTWASALTGILVLSWMGLLLPSDSTSNYEFRHAGAHWIATPLLIFFCLLQAQVGILRRQPFLINLALTFIGLHTITAYFQLFGSMATTGLMFLSSGVLFIVLAIYLERKRRSLLQRMRSLPPA